MFKNKTVIITGAATGIGHACAEIFAEAQAVVYLLDIDAEKGSQAAKALSDLYSTPVHFKQVDVSQEAQINDFVGSLSDIHVLVNNAGTIFSADFLTLSSQDFDRVLSVNLRGAFLMGQAVAKKMVANNIKGSIVNMSSVNGVMAIPNQVPYVVSKGGLNQLTKVMALSLAPHGIRVNGVGPGSILTELLKVVMTDEAAQKRILSRTPMGRCGEPSEIAKVVRFLASEDASYMTGQTIYADGGRLALNYVV